MAGFDLVTREYINTATKTITEAISSSNYNTTFRNLEHFEREACSCSPLRQQEKRLIEEKNKLSAPIVSERAKLEKRKADIEKRLRELRDQELDLHRPLTAQQEELRRQIRQIDLKEHGPINEIYRTSRHWVRLWVTEKMATGSELPDGEKLPKVFLDELAKGWRPQPPKAKANA